MKALSLFSGAGGDSLGLEQAGYDVCLFSEKNKDAIETHRAQFPHAVLLEHNGETDIQKLPDEVFTAHRHKINLIFAGFPCQGFSHAGKKNPDDPRNELVHEFVRATRLIEPEWIIGENVKGLLSREGKDASGQIRPVIDIITNLFHSIGYRITYKVMNAADYGVPQLRKRLIIIGHRGPKELHWELPMIRPIPTIRSFLEPSLENSLTWNPPDHEARFTISTRNSVSTGTPHPNLVRLVQGIRGLTPSERAESDEKTITEANALLSYGSRSSGYHGEVVDPDAPSKTIICTYQSCPRLFVELRHGNTYYLRTLTIRELAQIQGFPADYPFRGPIKSIIQQIGNAVPPPLIRYVAESLPSITFMNRRVIIETETETETEKENDESDDE
jgi:DNA (cytosine-5)-methyltransferase 1